MKQFKKIIATASAVALSTSAAFAQEATGDIPPVTLFKNVMVFDGVNDGLKDVDVLVVGNKIHKMEADIPEEGTWEVEASSRTARSIPPIPGVGDSTGGYTFLVEDPTGETKTVQAEVNVIEGGGRTLMPGLIDMHVHLNMQFVGSGNDRSIQGAQLMTWEELGALAYPSQREAGYQRSQRRADTIRERLGWQSGLDSAWGPKPKGMHRRTYERLVTELEDYEQASDNGFAVYFMQRFGKLGL